MARKVRAASIETRTARLKLVPRRLPYGFVNIGPGLAISYRRNRKAPGTFNLRKADGKGGRWLKTIAVADDFEDSNGEDVLSFHEACDRGRQLARGADGGADDGRPATWAEAIDT